MPDLDPRQAAAVEAGPGDLFIAAGAGSGKTRVLTSRFVSAVLGESPYEPCAPGELLAVTFTEKAAGELAERVRRALSAAGEPAAARAVGDAWISTIHGMCSRILRQHAFQAGIDPLFRMLDQAEASALEADALDEAIRALLERDPGASGLFDAYAFVTIASAAGTVRASVRALGLDVADIDILPTDAAVGQLRHIGTKLSAISDEMERLGATKTVATNTATVRSAAGAIAHATSQSGAISEGLLCELSGRGMRHSAAIEGLDELIDAAAGLIAEARECAAQVLVGQHETAFLTLVRTFEEQYAALKDVRGVLDFEDLQVKTALLLESHPAIAAAYRKRFSMLMLDEFQDTNALQLRILEALARENLCTVGDENQSIYAFRHADVAVFRERELRVQDRRQLDINYRMAPPLLSVINGLFAHPALLGSRFMPLSPPAEPAVRPAWPLNQPRFEARFIDWSDAKGIDPHQAEAECIADRVTELLSYGIEPGSIAVLMRALAGGRASSVEQSLAARGIPSYLAGGGAFFDCPEVVEARALLRLIDNVRDDVALVTVLAGRLTGLAPDSLVRVRALANRLAAHREGERTRVHLWDALTSEDLQLDERDAFAAARTVGAVNQARHMRGTGPLGETVLQALLALDADLVWFASGAGGARAWSNMLKLVRLATDYESVAVGDLGGFLGYLDVRELHSTSEPEATLDGESDAVRVMSIHAAKGLEFPVVIVAGLSGKRDTPPVSVARVGGRPLLGMMLPFEGSMIPTSASARIAAIQREAAEAEAVRLLYVAFTRAQEGLTVVGRTDPLKEADESLTGLVRRALGVGAENCLARGDRTFGGVSVRVTLADPPRSGGMGKDAPEGAAEIETTPGPYDGGSTAAAPTQAPPPLPASVGSVPARVSYTGLATYGRCPYRFYLTSIAKLPAPPSAQGGEALAFGSAVHMVLERCRHPHDDPAPWIDAALLATGLSSGSRARLAAAVDAYRSSQTAAETWRAPQTLFEAPIAVPVGGTVLAGAIDVIAWNGDEALIVDYKTGTGPLTAQEAAERYRLQAECYALAAFAAGADTVRVVFSELERARETDFTFAVEDCARIRADVEAIIGEMGSNGFAPRAFYERELCETCPGLGGVCPVTRPLGGAAG